MSAVAPFFKSLIFSVSLLAILACGQKLTQAEARELILSSSFLNEASYAKLTLYKNTVFSADSLLKEHPDTRLFLSAGLAEIRPNSVLFGREIGARIALTAEGERLSASGWQRATGSKGEEAWLVPTFRRELVEVFEPVTSGESAECEFSWKWAGTKLGDAIGARSGTENSPARFRLSNKKWQLVEKSLH